MTAHYNEYNEALYKKDLAELDQIRYDLKGLDAIAHSLSGTELTECFHLRACLISREKNLARSTQEWHQNKRTKDMHQQLLTKARKAMTGETNL